MCVYFLHDWALAKSDSLPPTARRWGRRKLTRGIFGTTHSRHVTSSIVATLDSAIVREIKAAYVHTIARVRNIVLRPYTLQQKAVIEANACHVQEVLQ